MALPVVQFPALTAAQANPLGAGIQQANTLYQQSVQNQYLPQMLQQQLMAKALANKISQAQANVAPQISAAQLAYQQAKTPNLNATTQYILGGQLPTSQAQAGLIGTESAKNQFALQHPATLLPGLPGQIGAIGYLKQIMANNGSGTPSPVPYSQNNGQIPGMPSAGNMGAQSQSNAPILPNNPYPAQGNQTGIPTRSSLTNLLMKGVIAPIQEKIAQANYYQSQAGGYDYKSLPPTEKSYMIAQAAGMGVSPLQAAHYYNNGGNLTALAQAQGLDPNNLPTPLYAPTQKTLGLIQLKNQAKEEINTIQPIITQSLAPYSRRFNGFSPQQIASGIANDNPDQQARFLAAKGLNPEMSALRVKAMGGNVGIEAIREISNQSMGNIKAFQGLVSPKVYTAAQQYIDQWINQGAAASNKVGLAGALANVGGKNPATQTNFPTSLATPVQAPISTGSAMVRVIDPSGRTGRIPASNLAQAMKAGYRSAQ